MTLLIGAAGSDGIALGADQKMMLGGEAYYSRKINIVEGVAFATEGYTGLAEDFLLLLSQEVARKKGFGSLYEAKTVAEDIIWELGQRYMKRIENDSPIGLIMAGLESISSGPAKMYYIYPQGYGEIVRFRCSGSGGTYANTLAKFLHNEKESAEENARRIAFVINWIAEDVDTNVGGTPNVAILLNEQKSFQWLPTADVDEMGRAAKSCKADLWRRLGPAPPESMA
jgi:20S proteasome alpha/beta subunit